MNELDRAINEFYAAFSDVPVPRHIDGCPCCIDNKRIPVLLASPLRGIPADDLAAYASSALLTVGDVSDYIYFLPRIIDLSIHDPSWWPDIEITAKAIRAVGFSDWPSTRQNALKNVLDAVFDHFLSAGVYWELDGWLCAVALLGLDVGPYLAKIETDVAAVLHYFEDNEQCLKTGRLCSAFWELPNAGHDKIIEWLQSPRIRGIPFDAYGYLMPTPDKPQ